MPKCAECGNDKNFLVAYIEFEVQTFQGDKVIDTLSGDRDRFDHEYPPECADCGSTDIENKEVI